MVHAWSSGTLEHTTQMVALGMICYIRHSQCLIEKETSKLDGFQKAPGCSFFCLAKLQQIDSLGCSCDQEIQIITYVLDNEYPRVSVKCAKTEIVYGSNTAADGGNRRERNSERMRKQESDRNTESIGVKKAINGAIQLASLYRREERRVGGRERERRQLHKRLIIQNPVQHKVPLKI